MSYTDNIFLILSLHLRYSQFKIQIIIINLEAEIKSK